MVLQATEALRGAVLWVCAQGQQGGTVGSVCGAGSKTGVGDSCGMQRG